MTLHEFAAHHRLLTIYLAGILPSWWLIAGMMFSEILHLRLTSDHRHAVRVALVIGLIGCMLWPVALPFLWWMTRFAEFGVWRRPEERRMHSQGAAAIGRSCQSTVAAPDDDAHSGLTGRKAPAPFSKKE